MSFLLKPHLFVATKVSFVSSVLAAVVYNHSDVHFQLLKIQLLALLGRMLSDSTYLLSTAIDLGYETGQDDASD